jgi:hypothetical protein
LSGEITLIYVVAAICFILALKGLSSPTTARRGNIIGIVGMVVAIATTVFYVGGSSLPSINPDAITKSMPQLVAAFHSLVGLAAVFIAAAAFYAPHAYGIGTVGNIKTASLIEMSLGSAIGAITFTGSVVAFAKLQGLVSGAPVVFKGQHLLNLLIGLGIVVDDRARFCGGRHADHPHWGRRYARCDLHVELLFRVGSCGYRVYLEQPPSDHHGRPGRIQWRHPQLYHVQGHESVFL